MSQFCLAYVFPLNFTAFCKLKKIGLFFFFFFFFIELNLVPSLKGQEKLKR